MTTSGSVHRLRKNIHRGTMKLRKTNTCNTILSVFWNISYPLAMDLILNINFENPFGHLIGKQTMHYRSNVFLMLDT